MLWCWSLSARCGVLMSTVELFDVPVTQATIRQSQASQKWVPSVWRCTKFDCTFISNLNVVGYRLIVVLYDASFPILNAVQCMCSLPDRQQVLRKAWSLQWQRAASVFHNLHCRCLASANFRKQSSVVAASATRWKIASMLRAHSKGRMAWPVCDQLHAALSTSMGAGAVVVRLPLSVVKPMPASASLIE